jgi:hypothetical protein
MNTAPPRVQVEKIFGLSNLQQGILFHCIEDSQRQIYLTQLCLDIEAELDLARLEASWNAIVARHDVLRSSFVWKKVKAPVQAVQARAPLSVSRHDLQALPEAERSSRIESWLAEDRLRPINLQKPPLMRVAVLQTGPRAHTLVWTHHHILLDGWSVAQVLSEVFAAYKAGGAGGTLPAVALGFDAYLRHVDLARDRPRASRFWNETLRGYRPRPTVCPDVPGAGAVPLSSSELKLHLDRETTERLSAFARGARVTLGTCLIAAWTLTVSRFSGLHDVVLGVVQSGRPSGLAGVETLVGLCSCTLPLRVRIPSGCTVSAWLEDVQKAILDVEEHQHTPLVDVRAAAGLPGDVELFDTIVAVENFPVQSALAGLPDGWQLTGWRGFQTSNFASGLIAMPTDELELVVPYSAEHFSPAAVQAMLDTMCRLLRELPRFAQADVKDLAAACSGAAAPSTAALSHGAGGLLERALLDNAQVRPSAVALADADGSLSWRDLVEQTAGQHEATAPAKWDVGGVSTLVAALRAGRDATVDATSPVAVAPGASVAPCRIGPHAPGELGPWLAWGAAHLGFTPGEAIVVASSRPTALALGVVLLALAAGARVILAAEPDVVSPPALAALARQHAATWLYVDSLDTRTIDGSAGAWTPGAPRLLLPGMWPLLGRDIALPASFESCAWLYLDEGGELVLIERGRRVDGHLRYDQASAPGRTLQLLDPDGEEVDTFIVGQLTPA